MAPSVTTSLANDSRFNIVRQINTEGGHVDMPPNFGRAKKTPHFATFNPTATGLLQSRRIRFHYSGCPTAEELQNLHCANEYHWRAPRTRKSSGQTPSPLLECSNAPPGLIPLNSDFTRLRGIGRYQQVKLPQNPTTSTPLMYKYITILVHAEPAGRAFAYKQLVPW